MSVFAHIDCNAFFASCEQAVHPQYRDKPLMTGMERGIVAAASYPAKSKGVTRGMLVHEAKRACRGLVVLPSDYETYSLFSMRLFEILRRYSPCVEEYSIDEGFCDLTGLHRTFGCSHEQLAHKIQDTIDRELDIGVSVGVGVSKVLAKAASKHRKPRGITMLPRQEIHEFLKKLPVGDVWGIGKRTERKLLDRNVLTAYDYAAKPESWILGFRNFTKVQWEIWSELNGRSVYPVIPESRSTHYTIAKCKTFTPPSNNPAIVFAQLALNMEQACAKARMHKLEAQGLVVYLRTKDFFDSAIELKLPRATADPLILIKSLREGFNELFFNQNTYRLTGAILTKLKPADASQLSLFDDGEELERRRELQRSVDEITSRYGKHTLCLGSSLPALVQGQHAGDRGKLTWRQSNLLPGEDERRHLSLLVTDYKI